jgi:hypothetical protein
MASSIGTTPVAGVGTSFIPDLADTANIQTALKLLYYGTTQAATTNGIYGSLASLQTQITATQSGVNVHETVKMATTGALGTSGNLVGGTITTTYTNGTADASGGTGVGATLTIATSSNWSAITIDGQSLVVGNRVIIKDQATSLQNGIYTVTSVGAVGNTTSFVFTRATDSDNHIAGEFAEGDFAFVSAGTTNGNTSWVLTSASPTGTSGPVGTIKIGTDPVTYIQFGSITWGSQTANTFFAAPDASAGTPTFRRIIGNDLSAYGNPSVSGSVLQWSTGINATTWTSTAALLTGGGTMTGALNLAAGTTSIVPLDFNTTGALLSTPAIGSMETVADGIYYTNNPGTTSTGPGRGIITAPQMVLSLATSSSSNAGTAVNIFASANDVLSVLEPAKLYRFRAKYYSTFTFTSGISGAINAIFAFSNAPTAFKYSFKTYNQTASAATAWSGATSVTTTSGITTTLSATGSFVTEIDGYFTTHATLASTFTPQFACTASTQSTGTMNAGSWIEVEKLGTSTQTLIAGNWA